MRKNGRSLAGGWATDRRRSGPEATTRRGGRDTQDGWLDCRSKFELFHKNNNKLSFTEKASAYGRIFRPSPTPRNGAGQRNHQSIDLNRSNPIKQEDRSPPTRKSPHTLFHKPPHHQPTQNRNLIAPTANVPTATQLLPSRHQGTAKFLRVFPHTTAIFDRRFKNPHIISAALPTAVGPSLRPSGWQAGQAKRLRNARRITMSFRTRRPLRGLQEPGPATHHSAGGPSSCVSGVSHVLAPGAVRLRKSCRLCPYD